MHSSDCVINSVIQNSIKSLDFTCKEKREDGIPTGLVNIGNSCYFSTILQNYFFEEDFYNLIMNISEKQIQEKAKQNISENIANSLNMIKQLRKLFAMMVLYDGKFVNPIQVLKFLKKSNGKKVIIGQQQDIGQLNLNFIERVSQAIQLLKQKNLTLKQKFIGKYAVEIVENNKTFLLNSQNEGQNFNCMYLDVKWEDIYSAIEKFLESQIDSQKNKKRKSWIIFLPTNLFIQLQRASYDKDKKIPVKIHNKFQIPKEIVMDRFFYKNKEWSMKLNEQYIKKKKQLGEKKQLLRELQPNEELKLFEYIKKCREILSKAYDLKKIKVDLSFSKQQIGIVQRLLTQTQKKFQEKSQMIKKQIQKVQKDIHNIFISKQQYNYKLKLIVIHQGKKSGHYYSYIYDQEISGWWKLNDSTISKANQQIVFKQAQGINNISASYLMYIRKNKNVQKYRRNYMTSNNKKYMDDHYSKKISEQLKEYVMQQNSKLMNQIQKKRIEEKTKQFIIELQIKFNILNKQYKIMQISFIKYKFLLVSNIFIFALNILNSKIIFIKLIAEYQLKQITLKNEEYNSIDKQLYNKFNTNLDFNYKEYKSFKTLYIKAFVINQWLKRSAEFYQQNNFIKAIACCIRVQNLSGQSKQFANYQKISTNLIFVYIQKGIIHTDKQQDIKLLFKILKKYNTSIIKINFVLYLQLIKNEQIKKEIQSNLINQENDEELVNLLFQLNQQIDDMGKYDQQTANKSMFKWIDNTQSQEHLLPIHLNQILNSSKFEA